MKPAVSWHTIFRQESSIYAEQKMDTPTQLHIHRLMI